MSIETVTVILLMIQFGFVLLFLLYYLLIHRPRAKAERDALRTRVSELESDNVRLERENEALRAENSELRAKIHSLQIENQRLQNQVSNLTAWLIGAGLAIPAVAGLVAIIMQNQ